MKLRNPEFLDVANLRDHIVGLVDTETDEDVLFNVWQLLRDRQEKRQQGPRIVVSAPRQTA